MYLPADRAFSRPGYGTVVTGTLRRGTLRVGQKVGIAPGGETAEVRGLQVHHQAVEQVSAGQRVAVNLRGLKRDDLPPGAALATPDWLAPTRLLDAQIDLLPGAPAPIERGQPVRLHWGTADAAARVFPLGRDVVQPGDSAPVQLRLETEVALPRARERFVLRAGSPAATVGGGTVADAHPVKHTRRADAQLVGRRVTTLATGDPSAVLHTLLAAAGSAGVAIDALARTLGWSDDRVRQALTRQPNALVCAGALALDRATFERLSTQAHEAVRAFHAANPARAGMPKEELRALLPPDLPQRAFNRLLDDLRKSGRLETEEAVVRAAGFTPRSRAGTGGARTGRDDRRPFSRRWTAAARPRRRVGHGHATPGAVPLPGPVRRPDRRDRARPRLHGRLSP